MEAVGRRVGVRWNPPALIYVYQSDQVLRLARLPLRDLEDEDVVDRVYKKHEDGLLKGLERRHVERMVTILRHHHGLDSARKTDCTSDCPSEDGASLSRSQKIASQTSVKSAHDEIDKRGPVNFSNSWNPAGRLSRGGDVLLLLDEASRKREENSNTEQPLESKKTFQKLPKIPVEIDRIGSKQNFAKFGAPDGIIKEKSSKVSCAKDEAQGEAPQTGEEKSKKRELVEDNSEDTDLDLDDLDIPLDPVQHSTEDDFWS